MTARIISLTFAAAVFLQMTSSVSTAQTILSFDELRTYAIQSSEQPRLARLRIEQREHELAELQARRLPSLTVSAAYTHISESAGIDFDIPGLPSRRISFGDGNVYDLGLTASVPLFTGFRMSHLAEARKHGIQLAREEVRAREIEAILRASALYRQAQLALLRERIYDEQLRHLAEQQRLLVQLHEQGQAMSYDTLVLSTRMAELELARSGSRRDYRNSLLTLSAHLSIDQPFDVEHVVRVEDAFADSERERLLLTASESRPDLRLLSAAASVQHELSQAERASLYPTVSAVASLRYGRPGVDQIANDWMQYYTAGLSLQWKLWAWGADRHAIEARTIDEQHALLQLDHRRRLVEAEVDALLNDLAVLRLQRTLLGRQIAVEVEKQRVLDVRWRQGLATSAEVVDAESSLTTAKLAETQAAILYAMKIQELAAAIGRHE
jgi:outer membrane protein